MPEYCYVIESSNVGVLFVMTLYIYIVTRGNNERLEFLGDTILQLITSEFLFKHFPTHHEGHLSVSTALKLFTII